MEDSGNKKFYLIAAAVVAIWTISLLILAPAASGIKKERAEIDKLSSGIENLFEEEYPPQGEYIEAIEQQQRMLGQQLNDLVQKIDYPKQDRFRQNNSAFFNHHCKLRLEKLQRRAKQLGVSISSSIFPRSPSDTMLKEAPCYWSALDAGSRIASLILETNSDKARLYSISKIFYPGIQKRATQVPFVREFPINVTFESDFAFAVKLLKQCSCATSAVYRYLFSIESQQRSLDQGRISDDLRKKFAGNNDKLSPECRVEVIIAGRKWKLRDKNKHCSYTIAKEARTFNVYRQTALAFLKAKNVNIKKNVGKKGVIVKITLVVFFVNLQGRLKNKHSIEPASEVEWGKDWKQPNWDSH